MRPEKIQEILDKCIDDYPTLESVQEDFGTLKEYHSSLPLGRVDLALCKRINVLYQYINYWPCKVMQQAYDEIRKNRKA